jgi:hypothetical protein
MIKDFDDYIKIGIVKKGFIDKERAKNLIKDSERKIRVLEKQITQLGEDEDMLNEYILICYDSLMLLIRANMFLKGYNSSGINSHEAEISYAKILGINERDIQFLDQLRYFRNGMLYYGTILDKEYAEKVIDFTKRIYLKLKEITKL